MDPYENLANAIILQAVDDYRKALKLLVCNPGSLKGQRDKNDCERFFRSPWFRCLTEIDGEFLIRKLMEEVK